MHQIRLELSLKEHDKYTGYFLSNTRWRNIFFVTFVKGADDTGEEYRMSISEPQSAVD